MALPIQTAVIQPRQLYPDRVLTNAAFEGVPRPTTSALCFTLRPRNYAYSSRYLLVLETARIPTEIEDDIFILEFRTPSHAELRELWDVMVPALDKDWHPKWFGTDDVDVIIQNGLGMSQFEFDTALAATFVELSPRLIEANQNDEQTVTVEDFTKGIMKYKLEVIKKTDILELMPPALMSEIGGLDLLKTWVIKRRGAFRDEARDFGIAPPRGVLLVGPPL
jgi:hypothetical protein